jgi:phospholipid-binding lipoprotein MlaA
MVQHLLILVLIFSLFFQACSSPVSVGYNKNIVVDADAGQWFDAEIELPENCVVEYTVIGAVNDAEIKKSNKLGFSVSDEGVYNFETAQKKRNLSSEYFVFKAKVNSNICIVDSFSRVTYSNGGSLMFAGTSSEKIKQIINVNVKEISPKVESKSSRNKNKMEEARQRLAKDLNRTKARKPRNREWKAVDESQQKSLSRLRRKARKEKKPFKLDVKNRNVKQNNYVETRKKQEIPPFVDGKQIEVIQLSEDEVELLSDILGIADPIEPFNRFMFKVDNVLFVYILSPIGKVYSFVIPNYFRQGFKRMDYNIQMPKRLFNNLLQAKFAGAGISLSRFLVNTTIGIIGFYDPAYEWFGWEKYDEDLGQTLGKWGIGPGFYVYVPIIGATSVRDGLGGIIDDQMDPRAWIPFGGSGIRFIMKFNNVTLEIDDIEQKLEEYFDPYSLKKNFWYMKRTAEIDD